MTAAVPTEPALVDVKSLKLLTVPTVGTVGNFSDLTSTAAGSVGTAAVTLDHHTMSLTGGTGTGVVLTGQFVTDLTVD